MSFQVRTARREDISRIVELEMSSMGPLWEKEGIDHEAKHLKKFIENRFEADRFWVAEDPNSDIVGFLHSTTYRDAISSTKICEIFTVIVHPNRFGMGIGGALMEYEREAAAKDGVYLLKLEVLSGNYRAQKFYDSQGFRERKRVMTIDMNKKNTVPKSDPTDFPLIPWLLENKDVRFNLASSSMPPSVMSEFGSIPQDVSLEVDTGITAKLEERVRDLYGDDVEVLITPGTQSANVLAYTVLTEPGDTIVVENPTYAPLRTGAQLTGHRVIDLDRSYHKGFVPEVTEIPEHAKMVVLTNPHNPSGVYMESLRAIQKSMPNGILLVDEIYMDHLKDGISAVELGQRTMITSGLSKVYGLGGLRVGWLASRDVELINRLRRVKPHILPFNSVLSEHMALRFFEKREDILPKIHAHTETNLKIVGRWVENTDGIEWVLPSQGIISFPKLTADCTSLKFAQMARDRDVLVVPGEYMGVPGHIRLTFRLDPEDLKEALSILSAVLQDI